MIEKWRESIDTGGNFGTLLTDLSKTFDCLLHDLLIAKLHAYGLDMSSLKLLRSYLTKRRNSKCRKLLGIETDSKLMFDSHVKSLCKKAS